MYESLADPTFYASEAFYETFDDLRRASGGIAWTDEVDGPGFWSVGSHAGVSEVLRDRKSFTSERGMMLGVDRVQGDPAATKMLVATDPPRHSQLRGVLATAFRPRTVAGLRTSIRFMLAGRRDGLLDPDGCEFVEQVSSWLPCATVCALLGVPESDWRKMYELTSLAFGADDPDVSGAEAGANPKARAHASLLGYFSSLLRAKRAAESGDDLISVMAAARIDGVPLTDEEIILNCDNLVIGGIETTRQALNGVALSMVSHRAAWNRVVDSEDGWRRAVDEVLRWTSPALHTLRVATRPVDVLGQSVQEGDAVVVWLPSANRDPAVFDEPDIFSPGRAPGDHIAFGGGHHFCLGAALARVEIEEVARLFLTTTTTVRSTAAPRRLRSLSVIGHTSVPLTVETTPSGSRTFPVSSTSSNGA